MIITVFTPTYNRAKLLPNLYESLCRQTSQNFCWLVIDDGSTDNTEQVINTWIKEQKLSIRYIKQKNLGMLAAHNTAYDNVDTELNVCIDSDDYMTDNAIEIILKYNEEFLKNNADIAGILGLDINSSRNVIGKKFRESPVIAHLHDIVNDYPNLGDKKHIYKTSIINEYARYPEYEKERYPSAGMLYLKIAQKYSLVCINDPICVVEYLPGGNTKNKMKQYKTNPNAFADYRLEKIAISTTFSGKFKSAIHYVSSKLFAKKVILEKKTPYKMLIFFAIPFGYILNAYIKNEIKNQ